MSTHLKNKVSIVFLAITIFYSCGDEQKSEKIVVKLKEAVLTKKMLDSALTVDANQAKLKDELINDWIETEVLYNEAVKEGILDQDDYIALINKSKKELAGTFYLKKILDENNLAPTENDIEKYFNDNKDDFKLKEDLYKLNFLRTSVFEKAVQARNKILETGWSKAKDFYRSEHDLAFSTENLFKSAIASVALLRVVNSLIYNETSIVIETQPGIFVIVSVESKYLADTVPPFEVVKENAAKLLTALRQKEFVREHIKKLVEENNLEIVRYTE